jgi:response regulator NasT
MFLSAFADSATRQKVQELGAVDYLIKPLDVGQIIPAVDAALARLRGVDAVGATPAPAVNAAELLADPVPLAVGLLMHRHSLMRGEALRRLQRLAEDQKLPLPALAEKLLGAVEELARTAI